MKLAAAALLALCTTQAHACTQYPATYTPRDWPGKDAVHGYIQNRLTERPFATIIMGDSIARRWPSELVEGLWGGPVLNTGIGGSTVLDLTWRLDRMSFEAQSPAVVFVSVGTNDIAQGYCPGAVEQGIVALLVRLRTMYPNARVVWQNVLGRGRHRQEFVQDIARVNAYVIAQVQGRYEVYDAATPLTAACRGQPECTLYADLVHPYLNGYEVIYEQARVLP